MAHRWFHEHLPCRAKGMWRVVALVAGATAWGTGAAAPAQQLQVERIIEGSTTIVRHLAGSHWPGPAVLVEEMSIGVLEGNDAAMFGRPNGLWATDDRIYVVDFQIPAVRAYDQEGKHLLDFGTPGQGPGEYEMPSSVASLDDGTLLVVENNTRRATLYTPDGEVLRTWTLDVRGLRGVYLLEDGALLVRREQPLSENASWSARLSVPQGVSEIGANGQIGPIRYPPQYDYEIPRILIEQPGGFTQIPGDAYLYHPSLPWAVGPDGSLVAGLPTRYRFEIHPRDGRVTVVERDIPRVPLPAEHADYAIRRVVASMRRTYPGYVFDGVPPPANKPAYDRLRVDRDGRIWVQRKGPSEWIEGECVRDPLDRRDGRITRSCWRDPRIIDVFSREGEYLGEVQRPEGLTFYDNTVFIRGDLYFAAVEDEDGLVTVKRFRIVGPDGR